MFSRLSSLSIGETLEEILMFSIKEYLFLVDTLQGPEMDSWSFNVFKLETKGFMFNEWACYIRD